MLDTTMEMGPMTLKDLAVRLKASERVVKHTLVVKGLTNLSGQSTFEGQEYVAATRRRRESYNDLSRSTVVTHWHPSVVKRLA